MLWRKRFLVGGIIVFLAIGYLCYLGFTSSATYYYTVGELLDQPASIYGQNVRVNGYVAPDSIEQEPGGLITGFTLVDGEESLSVVYRGVVPDTFQVSSEVVVKGYLDAGGVFQANSILTKCPSKYEDGD